MKKIFLCTFVPLVCILPTFSFANPLLLSDYVPIDWCANHCFDCQTNSKKAKDGDCFKCHYTNDELKSECTKIDEIHQANNPQSQANAKRPIDWCANHCFDCQTNRKKYDWGCIKCHYTIDELKRECTKIDEIHQANNPQPQANVEQPQANAEQPQTNAEQPKANAEQPKANAEQPKEETDYTVRKPAGRCSVTPYLPSSTSIAWLILLLISLGLLIHLRRLEK